MRADLRLWLSLLFVLFAVANPVLAESFTCPQAGAEISLEAGPEQKLIFNGVEFYNHPGFPNRLGVQPDMGGDYDELAPRYEWNGLNINDVAPVFALCQGRNSGDLDEIKIPSSIHRCLQPKKGRLVCKSGTISYSMYTDRVRFEEILADGSSRTIFPSKSSEESDSLLWQNLDGSNHKYRAICFNKDAPAADKDKGTILEIPQDMKACSLQDFRFRCTDNPTSYDDFWPQDLSKIEEQAVQRDVARLNKKKNAIFCPINTAHAQISTKHVPAIDPSLVNGDERYIEWTSANFAAESPPFVAECYDKHEKKTSLPLPDDVKRCRLQNRIFQCWKK